MPSISVTVAGNAGSTALVQTVPGTSVTLSGGGGSTSVTPQNVQVDVLPPEITTITTLPGGGGGTAYDQSLNTSDSVAFAGASVGSLTIGSVATLGVTYGSAYLDTGMFFAGGLAYVDSYGNFYSNGVQIGTNSWQEVYTGGGGYGIQSAYDVVLLNNYSGQVTLLNGHDISTDGTNLYIDGTAIGGGGGGGTSYDQSLNTTDVVKFSGLITGTELGGYVHSGSHRAQIVATGTQTPLMIEGGSGAIEIWKDTSPSAAVSFGSAVPGNSATSDFVFSRYASGWAERFRVVSGGGVKITPTSAPSSPTAGQIYYDSSSNHFFGYNGTTWKQLDN